MTRPRRRRDRTAALGRRARRASRAHGPAGESVPPVAGTGDATSTVAIEQRTDAKGGTDIVARSIVVDAPPEAVFEVLVQPARHADFDGSGSVKGRLRGAQRLSPGATFGMRMRIGLPYTIKNTVVAHEQDRTLAWRHLGHHVWRYDLEPVELPGGRSGTKVTESFDWSTSRIKKGLEVSGMTRSNAESIEKTLPRLKALVEGETTTG